MTTSYRNEISKRTIRTAPQSGKHHGEGPSDGAQRNARVASFVAARKTARENDKEKKIADRTAAAEKRKKETLAMATEESLTEAKHVFHVHMKSDDARQHKMVDDKTSEPIGAKPKDVKLVLKVPATDTREARNKVSRHLAKNYGVSAVKSIEYKGLEEQVSSGTEARTKIKNVSRPDDPAPDSKDSKLVKTGEIKTKKIDEGRSMSINRNFGLPESLIAATRELLEKRNESANNVGKGKTVVDTDPETNDRDVNDEVTEKKSKKKLDPVGKENDDIDNDGDVDKSDKYLHHRRKAIKKAVKEEVEEVDEAIKIGSRVKIHAPGKDYHNVVGNVGEIDHGLHNKSIKRYTVDYDNRSKSITVPKPQLKLHTEEAEQIDELKKSTLASYIGKASSDAAMKSYSAGRHSGQGAHDQARPNAEKASKRLHGIKTATGKLAKEEFSDAELARLEEIAKKFD